MQRGHTTPLHFRLSAAILRLMLPALAIFILAACSEREAPAEVVSAASSVTTEEHTANDGAASDETAPEASAEQSSKDGAVAELGHAPHYQGLLASLSKINIRDAALERVLPPIGYPWAFRFIGENDILLTQNSGVLSRFNLETGHRIVINGLPEIGQGYAQIGLMDVEVHPDFTENQRIYITFAKPHPEAPGYYMTEIATGILDGDQLMNVETLINADNYGWAPSNFGGALTFDDSGHLYATIGDRGEDRLSQRGDRLEGKILRLNADGSVPSDNPFVDKPGHDPRVYALGVRNSQGLHYDALREELIASDHGPLGGDEVNIIRPGRNYGWPDIGYGANYASALPMGDGTHRDDVEQPIFYYTPSIAVSPLTVYRGDMFHEWNGHIFVGALRGEHISKLDYDAGVVKSEQDILSEVGGRIRDIQVADDGSIYILSQTTGLHRLFRPGFDPEQSAADRAPKERAPEPIPTKILVDHDNPDEPHPGKRYYELVCSGCHDTGALDAPVLGDREAWLPIMEQPQAVTIERTLNGYNEMPARGSCHICSNFGLMQMVGYMFYVIEEDPAEEGAED